MSGFKPHRPVTNKRAKPICCLSKELNDKLEILL